MPGSRRAGLPLALGRSVTSPAILAIAIVGEEVVENSNLSRTGLPLGEKEGWVSGQRSRWPHPWGQRVRFRVRRAGGSFLMRKRAWRPAGMAPQPGLRPLPLQVPSPRTPGRRPWSSALWMPCMGSVPALPPPSSVTLSKPLTLSSSSGSWAHHTHLQGCLSYW